MELGRYLFISSVYFHTLFQLLLNDALLHKIKTILVFPKIIYE